MGEALRLEINGTRRAGDPDRAGHGRHAVLRQRARADALQADDIARAVMYAVSPAGARRRQRDPDPPDGAAVMTAVVRSVNVGGPSNRRAGAAAGERDREGAGRRTRARRGRQPGRRRAGRLPRPRRARQGGLRVRARGRAWWAERARARAPARDVRREPDDRGRGCHRRRDRRALADRHGRCSRSASRGCRASSSALRFGDPRMVKRFGEASPARRLPAHRRGGRARRRRRDRGRSHVPSTASRSRWSPTRCCSIRRCASAAQAPQLPLSCGRCCVRRRLSRGQPSLPAAQSSAAARAARHRHRPGRAGGGQRVAPDDGRGEVDEVARGERALPARADLGMVERVQRDQSEDEVAHPERAGHDLDALAVAIRADQTPSAARRRRGRRRARPRSRCGRWRWCGQPCGG